MFVRKFDLSSVNPLGDLFPNLVRVPPRDPDLIIVLEEKIRENQVPTCPFLPNDPRLPGLLRPQRIG
jgi:hypothetical protein